MAAPAVAPALAGVEALAGLTLVAGCVIFLMLHRAWISTIGWLMHKIADWIDFTIHLPLGRSIRPFEDAAKSIRKASDNVGNAFAHLALRCENGAVWFFHQARTTIVWVGNEIASLAEDTWHGIDELVNHYIPSAVGFARHQLEHAFKGIEAGLTRLEHYATHTFKGIEAGLVSLEHRLAHRILTSLHPLEALYGRTVKQIRRLLRSISGLEKATIGVGAAALVATALSRLGLRWLKCPALGRIGRKIGCGGFSWLEAFFADTFEALLVLDLCRFALAAQKLARFVVPQLGAVLLVENAVCLGGGASLPSAADETKASTKITLPSAV